MTVENARDVYITGLGAVSPLGLSAEATWAQLCAGKSGVRHIQNVDVRGLDVQIGGEIDLPGNDELCAVLGRRIENRKLRFALRAFEEALLSAKLTPAELGSVRTGIFTGCEKAETEDLSFGTHACEQGGHGQGDQQAGQQIERADAIERLHQQHILTRCADCVARNVAVVVGEPLCTLNYAMACAASAVALSQAVRWLRRGAIDRAIVIGADAPITSGGIHGFQMLGALSTSNDQPEAASRPFDANRDGFVLAEGAGALILESAALVRERNAPRHGRIVGIGISNNCYNMTKTPRDGKAAARAMRAALADAGLTPEQVGYVNAHATSTDVGDLGETQAIRSALRPDVPVSATKSMTGHLVAAAGAFEAVITALALREQFLPPTINHQAPDPDCDLDCVPNVGRAAAIEYAMTNSFGFGGTNVSLLLGRG